MNASQRLETYLDSLRRRLRAYAWTRAVAVIAAGVLIMAVLFVWMLVEREFVPALVTIGRLLLGAFVIATAAWLLIKPLRDLRRNQGAQVLERTLPEQRGRIATYLDARRRHGQNAGSPLIDLLADDALRLTRTTPVESIVPRRHMRYAAIIATSAAVALLALLTAGPGFWGFASRHLLLGMALPENVIPVRSIVVSPGDATIRRNGDVAIRASTQGFRSQGATLFVRFADQQHWERAPMQPSPNAPDSEFEFTLYGVRSAARYYVAAEDARSAEHLVTVADLPRIDRMRLTYRYPEWTGLAPQIDEHSREIRAVSGTRVDIEVYSDVPLENPVLVVDERAEPMTSRENSNTGAVAVKQAGRYRIAAEVAGELVALSDDYPIQIVADEKPTIEIEKPGRDWRATNIEEVPVRVRAEDDFRLANVELHYSVNGGEWNSLPLDRGVKQSRARTLLALEELGTEHGEDKETGLLMPGDLVSYYAVAKDHKRSVQTDLFMVQVQPFERRFLQQNASGGGGAGEEQNAISERQREILLATWNLQRSDARNRRSRQQLEDNAKMLSEMQATLAEQARTLATRTRARAQIEADERIKQFVESLERAALVMDPAALHLSAFELEKAVPVEQQALQQLLRAEAAFREVQVSMQSDAGAQGSQSARDFGEMFELEMDLEKSQYESESQVSQESTKKEMDEAVRKLKELAERQEQLAQEANRSESNTPEQRWRQEQLRREAEDLRRQLAAMSQRQQQSAQSGQSGQSGRSDSSSQQGGEPNEQQGEAGQQQGERNSQPSASEALRALDTALEEMRQANQRAEAGPEQSAKAADEAGKKLREAQQRLGERGDGERIDAELEALAERGNQLATKQRRIESQLYEALGEAAQSQEQGSFSRAIDPVQAQALVEGKQQMAEDLASLQKDLRDSVHAHRDVSDDAKQQLADLVNDLEASDLMYRVRRSAAEIYYGRAREAAAREGIITESLDNLEKDLREVAARTASETNQGPGEESASERLLAEVAALRRRLEQRERTQARVNGNQGAQGSRDPQQASNRQSRTRVSAGSGENDLAAWDPVLPKIDAIQLAQDADAASRESAAIAERARRLQERTARRALSAAEVASLRQMARELRQLAGDPLAGESQAMKQALEEIELAALSAVAKVDRAAGAHTPIPSGDSPQYREAVAEYYRRLGGG